MPLVITANTGYYAYIAGHIALVIIIVLQHITPYWPWRRLLASYGSLLHTLLAAAIGCHGHYALVITSLLVLPH